MDKLFRQPFAFIQGACSHEVVNSPNYAFDNSSRSVVPQVILQQTLAGAGEFIWNGRCLPVPPGACFIAVVPESSGYRYPPEATTAWAFRWINLRGQFVCDQWRALRERFGAVIHPDAGTSKSSDLGDLIAVVESGGISGVRAVAETLYSFYLTTWLRLEDRRSAPVRPVSELRKAILANFHKPVNLKELTAKMGQSREHLSRRFRQVYGISPAALLRQLRMESARSYLQRSTLPVHEVARRCGYPDPKRFSKAFAADHGLTASAFRRAIDAR